MTIPQISDPAEPAAIDFNLLHHSLLLVEVLGSDNIRTRMDLPGEPPKAAISANVTVLDGQLAGTVTENALIFPRVLVQQLKPRIGEWVVGRLIQGQAEAGKTAPWKLDKATEQDRALARAWFSRPGGQPQTSAPAASSFTPPQQPPAPAWQQPPAPAQGQLPLQQQEPPF
jgi:hypothetical protein